MAKYKTFRTDFWFLLKFDSPLLNTYTICGSLGLSHF
jgi:hypothetical protein